MPDATVMDESGLPVTIVNACPRDGRGGSPTAVLDETGLSDVERRSVPVRMGTSHAVFVSAEDGRSGVPGVTLRFFTATGELPACGHGTVAALAHLAERGGHDAYEATVRTSARAFTGQAARVDGRLTAAFEPGPSSCASPRRASTMRSCTPWA